MKVIPYPSPNFGARRGQSAPDLIVLHYTAMQSAKEALERLCSPEHEVSAHYLIAENGAIYQLVDEAERAWHAGAGSWGGVDDVNSASIGIELSNPGNAPFSAPLMQGLEKLLGDIQARHHIAPECVIAHSDCAPERKYDPGARFDWRRLALQGLSIWPTAGALNVDTAHFTSCLHRFGYSAQVPFEALLDAFRLRFFPHLRGPVTQQEMGLAVTLAEHHSIDRECRTS